MKKMSELMKEMGFKKDSNSATQEAFLKHLMKVSVGVSIQTPSEKAWVQANETQNIKVFPQQLEFDFTDEGPRKKKA